MAAGSPTLNRASNKVAQRYFQSQILSSSMPSSICSVKLNEDVSEQEWISAKT